MKEPTYRQALSHGWEIAKDHKLLWLFGFFATFLGQMGLLDFFVNVLLAADGRALGYSLFLDFPQLTQTLRVGLSSLSFGVAGWAWFFWLVVFFAAVKLFLIFISVTSQAALVHGVGQSMGRAKRKTINPDKAWHAGTGHFWRVFFINLLRRLAIVLLAVLVGMSAVNVAVAATVGSKVLFAAVFFVALALGMILSFLLVYAVGYVVLEEYSFGQSIAAAWNLFKNHALVSLEVGLILMVVNIVAGLVALLAGAVFLGHMAVFWVLTLFSGINMVWFIGFFLGMAALVLFIAALGTMLTVFTTSVWTYLFAKMHKRGIKSRLHHFFSRA